jgi:hypothetical protein
MSFSRGDPVSIRRCAVFGVGVVRDITCGRDCGAALRGCERQPEDAVLELRSLRRQAADDLEL